jgi:nitrite reductase (NADH) small subunit
MLMEIELENAIYNLGPVSRIPLGEGKEFRIDEIKITVFRTRAGQLFATQSNCPHREGPLADGVIGGGVVICPLHGYKFDLSSGKPIGNDCSALRTYKVSIDSNDEMLLDLKEGTHCI